MIRVAFIGAGQMAREHARAFRDNPDIKIVGIFSRTNERAKVLADEFNIKRVYDSVDELWNGTRAHLVVISVSVLATSEICKAAFRFPWQCLIEKPVGHDFDTAEAILKEAEQRQATAYVALNRRHYASTRAVLQAMEKTTEARLVEVFDQENPRAELEAGQNPYVVQNLMYANSIHLIDYLGMFCRGSLVDVSHIIPWDPRTPRYVLAKLLFSSGDIGIYHAVWDAPGPWAVTITTQSKRFEMRPLEQATVQLYKSRQADPMLPHPWDTQFKPGLRLQAEETVRALRGLPHRLPSLKEGFHTMQIINKIYDPKNHIG